MNYNYAHQLAEIIIKIWLNKASEEEREKLLSWLDENEENRQVYKSIIKGETLMRRLKSESKILESPDFDMICRDITHKLLKRRRQKRVNRSLYYATGCLLLFLSAWLFWPKSNNNNSFPTDNLSKVKLIMASGDVVNLDKSTPDSIDAATALIIREEKGIAYRAKNNLLREEEEVRHKIVTDTGGEFCFVLSDGTKVWLNSQSEIEYPVNFNGSERVVSLIGEAYFEVAHDAKKPFIVHSLNQTVQVLGTAFNIKAYADDNKVYTTLIEGRVSVGSGGNKVILTPGMESVCLRSNNGIEVQEVNVYFATSWKSGYFMFNDENLDEMLKVLQRWYGFEFNYRDTVRDSNTFSGRFGRYTGLEATLNAITLAGGPEFTISGDEKRVTITTRKKQL